MSLTSCQTQSPLVHLARSLGHSDVQALFGMFTAYYDAAGGKDHNFIVVAGWVSTVDEWERLANDWTLALAHYKLPYFHMKLFAQRKEPFHLLGEGERANLLRWLAEVICGYVRVGFATFVEYSAFSSVNKSHCLAEWVGNEYSFAGRDCAKESTKWVLRQLGRPFGTPELPLKHVFEDGDVGKGLLLSLMEKDNYPLPSFAPSRDIVKITPENMTYTVKGVTQLQAADFAAYELRKAKPLLELDVCLESHRQSMQALTEVPALRSIYKESDLLKFCDGYGVPKRIAGQHCPKRL